MVQINYKGWIIIQLIAVFMLSLSFNSGNAQSLSEIFHAPPDSVKPSGYWWWLNGNVDKEAITRDLEEFKDKGLGAVLLVSSGNFPDPSEFEGNAFLGDAWLECYKHALREAHRLGIKVDVNIAPGWNMGGPWVTPEKSSRWYLQSELKVTGPQRFKGKIPLPGGRDGYDTPPQFGVKTYIDMPLEEADYRDVSVIAFRTPKGVTKELKKYGDFAAKTNRQDGWAYTPADTVMRQTLEPWKSSGTSNSIKVEDVIDITSFFEEDGTLEWEVPEGEWTIVRTGHRMTGAKIVVPMPGQGGLENNYLDREGVELMFDSVAMVLIKAADSLSGKSLRGFCEDSFEAGYPNWSHKMLERFKYYRSYDPTPYLPVFKGYVVGSEEISERFLYDYRKTVADCFADEHYGRFTELCHENGLMTRVEAAGPSWSSTMCMDGLKNLGRIDMPQGEFWRYGVFSHREQNKVGKQTASAAHIYGKRTASAEALTAAGKFHSHWNATPADLKPDVDKAFCEGINNCVIHTITCQRPVDGLPGYEYGAGTHFTPNVTWWNQAAGPFLDYINRSQALLQSGLFVADVLYYNGDWAPNLVPSKHIDPGLGKGYDYDVCNAEVLLTRLSVKGGRLVLPDGMSYRLLVLPDSKRMPVEVLTKIQELVYAGATVVGPKPFSDPGLKNYPHCDSEILDMANKLWGDFDSFKIKENKVGKGRIIYGKTLRDILLAESVHPDVELEADSNTFIDFIHRTTDEAEIYFLANRKKHAEKVEITFRQTGVQPELWDPVSGKQFVISNYEDKNGRISIPLEFEAHGSFFIVFSKKQPANKKLIISEFKTIKKVKTPWRVQFDKEWFYPLDKLKGDEAEGIFVYEKLKDWTKSPHKAIKYYSGTAQYSTTFSFKKDAKSGEVYWLDLGQVNTTASVKLNGLDLGVIWCNPWRVNITQALKKGENQLEIEVVNQWPNRLIGDGKLPEDQRRTRTNVDQYYKSSVTDTFNLLPSGLEGPVNITKEIN